MSTRNIKQKYNDKQSNQEDMLIETSADNVIVKELGMYLSDYLKIEKEAKKDLNNKLNNFKYITSLDYFGIAEEDITMIDIFNNIPDHCIVHLKLTKVKLENNFPQTAGNLILFSKEIPQETPWKANSVIGIFGGTEEINQNIYMCTWMGLGSYFRWVSITSVDKPYTKDNTHIDWSKSKLDFTQQGNTVFVRGMLVTSKPLTKNQEHVVATFNGAQNPKHGAQGGIGNRYATIVQTTIKDWKIVLVPYDDLPADSYIFVNMSYKVN